MYKKMLLGLLLISFFSAVAFATPSLNLISPQNITYRNNTFIPINFTTNATNMTWYVLDGGPEINNLTSYSNFSISSEGTYNFTLYANDTDGSNTTNSTIFTYRPFVVNGSVIPMVAAGKNVSIALTIEDELLNYTSINVTLPNTTVISVGDNQSFVYNLTETSSTGRYDITLFATDTLGNNDTEEIYFDVEEPRNFTMTVNPTVTLALLYDSLSLFGGTGTFFNYTIPNAIWDLRLTKDNLVLNFFNLSVDQNVNESIVIEDVTDDTEYQINENTLVRGGYAINESGLIFDQSNMSFEYETPGNESSELVVKKCGNWTGGECEEWVNHTNSEIDNSTRTVYLNTESYSAFAVFEICEIHQIGKGCYKINQNDDWELWWENSCGEPVDFDKYCDHNYDCEEGVCIEGEDDDDDSSSSSETFDEGTSSSAGVDYLTIKTAPSTVSVVAGAGAVSVDVTVRALDFDQEVKVTVTNINSNWYSVNPAGDVTIEHGKEKTYKVTFDIPAEAASNKYDAKFKAQGDVSSATKAFTLDVKKGETVTANGDGEKPTSEYGEDFVYVEEQIMLLEDQIENELNEGKNVTMFMQQLILIREKFAEAKDLWNSGDEEGAKETIDETKKMIKETKSMLTGRLTFVRDIFYGLADSIWAYVVGFSVFIGAIVVYFRRKLDKIFKINIKGISPKKLAGKIPKKTKAAETKADNDFEYDYLKKRWEEMRRDEKESE